MRSLILLSFVILMGQLAMRNFSAMGLSAAPKRILCYGDSLTAGTSPPDPTLSPYAPHLESLLKEKGHNVVIRHRGLPGWTSSEMVANANDGTAGISTAVKAGMPLALVIILAGTNDLAFTNDASTITNNILALHQLCYEQGVPRTLSIGMPPSGYQSINVEAATLAQTINDNLKEYCQSESRATFMPFPFEFAANDEKWASDGLHLGPEGYRVLGTSLAPVVEDILTE